MGVDLTQDEFLGGRLSLWQPRKGYRAGVDAVLLAASIEAQSGQSVLELGCGVGTASLCLNVRVPDLSLTGVELQSDYAALARRNGLADVVEADLRNLPTPYRQRQYHHVMMNPPYFDRTAGNKAADQGRDIGRAGDTPLADWLDVGIKRLRPKGHLTLIQHITRLPEVLSLLQSRLGSLIAQPIAPREGQDPNLFLVRGQQDGRTPFRLAAPLILHAGAEHLADKEDYTGQIKSVLRDGAALAIGG